MERGVDRVGDQAEREEGVHRGLLVAVLLRRLPVVEGGPGDYRERVPYRVAGRHSQPKRPPFELPRQSQQEKEPPSHPG